MIKDDGFLGSTKIINSIKKIYGKNYHYYLEEVKNKYGKIIEHRIVARYPYGVIHGELCIKNCRFYDLRGSFATRTLRNGVEIRYVADILGHSKIETTEKYYISSSDETMKIACKLLEKVLNRK